MKKLLIAIVVLLVLGIGGYLFVNNYISSSLEPVDVNNSSTIEIEIPAGSSTTQIANILLDNKLIKDVNVFKFFAGQEGYDKKLKAGKFSLSQSMDVKTILEELIKSQKADNTIDLRLIEGLTAEESAASIAEQLSLNNETLLELIKDASAFRGNFKFLQENEDIEDLQGYLLPNTYNLYTGLSEKEVIEFLLGQFEKYYEETITPQLSERKVTLKELITLASIVEREAMLKEERSTIAGVFYNRLEIDMPLQSCATVNYILGDWKARLTNDDIAVISPYNTYLNTGLPPTPINSPGQDSIYACLYPEETEYMFFLAKGDGGHYFSKTYEEHLEAKKKYLD